jgi:hypothetical protein
MIEDVTRRRNSEFLPINRQDISVDISWSALRTIILVERRRKACYATAKTKKINMLSYSDSTKVASPMVPDTTLFHVNFGR